MTDDANFNKLSTYVGGIVDRKIKAISTSITGAGSYLRTLTAQAQTYSNNSLLSANVSAGHAGDAASAASSSLIVWNNFTSLYLGRSSTDPVISSTGNSVSLGAFYIRASDNRFRVVVSFNNDGTPNYADATVSADLSSLAGAGTGIFLSLLQTSSQTAVGPVNFQNTVLVPRVTSWTSQQAVTAVDVNDKVISLQTSINNEITRATTAETTIGNTKVAKSGDTMSGTLSIVANGDNSSLTIRNNNSTGRQFRINSTNDGRFRIVDDTGTVERFSFGSDGIVTINSGITTAGTVKATSAVINNNPSTDPTLQIQTNNVTRWSLARSVGSSKFYIARFNTSGVFIDSPIEINETDGSVALNKTSIRDTLTTNGAVRINSVGASYILNNTSGNNDITIDYKHLGNTRWIAGRSGSTGVYYINRFNSSGVYVDTPFYIREDNGTIVANSVSISSTLTVNSTITTPILYATTSGNGQAIRVGDDVWLGDGNIANGLTIRGVQDFNSGFIRFGNSNSTLGCTSSDSDLKYGGNKVYHSGNLTPNAWGYDYGTDGGVDWSTRPAGNGKLYAKYSGYMTFNQQRVAQTATYPFALEKIMDYQVSNVISNDTVDRDQLAQFVNAPSLTTVRVVMQETAGSSGYPIGVRWTVEGIVA